MSFVKKATVIYYKTSEDGLKGALNNTVNIHSFYGCITFQLYPNYSCHMIIRAEVSLSQLCGHMGLGPRKVWLYNISDIVENILSPNSFFTDNTMI